MFMPLLAASYPANVEFFCQMLLEVAAFDAIPAEDINVYIWEDSLQPDGDADAEQDIGKFEDLGYDGPYVLVNLTSSLIMLILSLVVFVVLLLVTLIYCCCYCCRQRKSYY